MSKLRPTEAQDALAERGADAVVGRALSAPLYVTITFPRTTTKAKLRLVSRKERFEAMAEARTFLQDAGFPVDAAAVSALAGMEAWNYESGVRLLQRALRNYEDPTLELATVEDLRECDDDQLDAIWDLYERHKAEVDPLAAGTLTEKDVAEISAAAKKADASLLQSFGSRRLALYVTTLASPPASSPTSES